MVSNVAGFGFIVKVLAACSCPFCLAGLGGVRAQLGRLDAGSSIPAWLAGAAVVPRALRYQLARMEGLFTVLVAVMPWLCRAVL